MPQGRDIDVQLPSNNLEPPFFRLALNLCQPISPSTVVGQSCGSVTGLQLLEKVDVCEVDKWKRDTQVTLPLPLPYCWTIQQSHPPDWWLVNNSDPSLGAWILFGNMTCCPGDGVHASPPGTIGRIPIKIKLEPPKDIDNCSDIDYFEVNTSRTSNFGVMFDCSFPPQPFIIFVLTSRLCRENIDYVLNPDLDCFMDGMMTTLNCTVTPGNNSTATSEFFWSLSRFQVEVTRSGTVTKHLLSELVLVSSFLPFHHGVSFLLSTKGLEKVAVNYSFEPFVPNGNIQHSPYEVMLHKPQNDDHSERNLLMKIIFPSFAGLLLIILIGYCLYRKFKPTPRPPDESSVTGLISGSGDSDSNPSGTVSGTNGVSLSSSGEHTQLNDPTQSFTDATGLHQSSQGRSIEQCEFYKPLNQQAPLISDARGQSQIPQNRPSGHYNLVDSQGQLIIKGQLLSEDRSETNPDAMSHDVFVIHHTDDAEWVDKHLKPKFYEYQLSVGNCHTPRRIVDVGKKLSDFIRENIQLIPICIVICSPNHEQKEGDFNFSFASDLALYQTVKDSKKLWIIATDDRAETVPEAFRIFTYTKWSDSQQRELLWEKLKSISPQSQSNP
jgi:hypothetical protein